MIPFFSHIIAKHKERQARARLEEWRQNTLSSYEHKRFLERRAAALKGQALKRERSRG